MHGSDAAWREVHGILERVFGGDAAGELERLRRELAEAELPPADRALLAASASMAAIIACDFDAAAALGADAADAGASGDVVLRRLSQAVMLMSDAMAGTVNAAERGVDVASARALLGEGGTNAGEAAPDGVLTRYLLTEAALSSGDFEAAGALLAEHPMPALVNVGAHPVPRLDGGALALHLVAARALAFRGRGAEVAAMLAGFEALGALVPARAVIVLRAIGCYAAAMAGDRETFAALAEHIVSRTRRDPNYLSVGASIYVVWGLRATAQLQRAAALLTSTAGARLERCKIWDRALGFELLVEAALQRGDAHSAADQLAQAEQLIEHRVAVSSVMRTRGVAALSAGESELAHRLALAAIRIDEAAGSVTEVHRGRFTEAEALVASEPVRAAAILLGIARDADALGVESVRLAAARRWRELSDTVPGVRGDAAVLTERQRQVAALVAEGHSNRVIGQTLYLSPRTVQSHVSEVLRLTGSRSRVQLAARRSAGAEVVSDELVASLSSRQVQIARLVAEGDRNAEIAEKLGISEKTVENHLAAVMRRLGVASRAAVASRIGA
ncbi:MAG: hypothetical protein DI534_08515 [Leifsonia xyli]|nr:MAG: hypothetical protein DI534_08515 [Leifsonia xyli]